ncbi:MAG: hypothetical protein IKC61_03325 [Clostridia bacterium]|nr:hypothetical protein [Clostridia bacterium]
MIPQLLSLLILILDLGKRAEYDVYLVDSDHNGELVMTTDTLNFEMPVHSIVMIKER